MVVQGTAYVCTMYVLCMQVFIYARSLALDSILSLYTMHLSLKEYDRILNHCKCQICNIIIPKDSDALAHVRNCYDLNNESKFNFSDTNFFETIEDIQNFLNTISCEKHKKKFKANCFDCLTKSEKWKVESEKWKC